MPGKVNGKDRETLDVTIQTRLARSEADRLAKLADMTFRTQSSLIRMAILKELGRLEVEHGLKTA